MIDGEKATYVAMPWSARRVRSVQRRCKECDVQVAIEAKNVELLRNGTIDLLICVQCAIARILSDDFKFRAAHEGEIITVLELVEKLHREEKL